jgi:IS5 family transposase
MAIRVTSIALTHRSDLARVPVYRRLPFSVSGQLMTQSKSGNVDLAMMKRCLDLSRSAAADGEFPFVSLICNEQGIVTEGTKKHGTSFFGYKNHVKADARHKLIRRCEVTDASFHDNQRFDGLVNQSNTARDVYADSAYRSAETERKLRAPGLRSRIHQRASRGHALSKAEEDANRQKSKVRVRVEPVFGAQQTSFSHRPLRNLARRRVWSPNAKVFFSTRSFLRWACLLQSRPICPAIQIFDI